MLSSVPLGIAFRIVGGIACGIFSGIACAILGGMRIVTESIGVRISACIGIELVAWIRLS